MGAYINNMALSERVVVATIFLFVFLALSESHPGRVRRGFGNSGYGTGGSGGGYNSGYPRGSDERDASVSGENNSGCSDETNTGSSGSKERAYDRDGRQSSTDYQRQRGGRSFTKASASASASASSYNQHLNNIAV